jgi:hypothetical protein
MLYPTHAPTDGRHSPATPHTEPATIASEVTPPSILFSLDHLTHSDVRAGPGLERARARQYTGPSPDNGLGLKPGLEIVK